MYKRGRASLRCLLYSVTSNTSPGRGAYLMRRIPCQPFSVLSWCMGSSYECVCHHVCMQDVYSAGPATPSRPSTAVAAPSGHSSRGVSAGTRPAGALQGVGMTTAGALGNEQGSSKVRMGACMDFTSLNGSAVNCIERRGPHTCTTPSSRPCKAQTCASVCVCVCVCVCPRRVGCCQAQVCL